VQRTAAVESDRPECPPRQLEHTSFCLTLCEKRLQREGNDWSHAYARRQWSLADQSHLRYSQLLAFEMALNAADDQYQFLNSAHQIAHADDERQVSENRVARTPSKLNQIKSWAPQYAADDQYCFLNVAH